MTMGGSIADRLRSLLEPSGYLTPALEDLLTLSDDGILPDDDLACLVSCHVILLRRCLLSNYDLLHRIASLLKPMLDDDHATLLKEAASNPGR